jgi:hypothetical protein
MYKTQTVTVIRKTHYLHFTKENGQIFGRDLHGAVENIPRKAEMDSIVNCPCGCGGVSIVFIEEEEIEDVLTQPASPAPRNLLDEIYSQDERSREFIGEVCVVYSTNGPNDRLQIWYKELKPKMLKIVGWDARIPELRTSEHYDALYHKCMEILGI